MPIDPKIWLNKVRAVPLVGLRINPTYEAAATLLERLRPILIRWQKAYGEVKFSLQKDMVLKIERPDGYELTLTHEAIICKFYYLSSIKEKGLRQPAMSYQVETQPIETLTDGAIEVVEEVSAELWKGGSRMVSRIGIVSTGTLDYEGMPPGFGYFLNHLGKPWGKAVAAFSVKLMANLGKGENSEDRCHHDISWDGEEESSVTFALDWQRVFEEERAMPLHKLKEELSSAKEDGFHYFGTFGIGNLNYENSNP